MSRQCTIDVVESTCSAASCCRGLRQGRVQEYECAFCSFKTLRLAKDLQLHGKGIFSSCVRNRYPDMNVAHCLHHFSRLAAFDTPPASRWRSDGKL